MQRTEGACKYVCLAKNMVSLPKTFENTVALNAVIKAIPNSSTMSWTISREGVHKLRSCAEIVTIGIKVSRKHSSVKTLGSVVAAKMDISQATSSASYSESGLVRTWKLRWTIGSFVNVCVSGRKPKQNFQIEVPWKAVKYYGRRPVDSLLHASRTHTF